MVEERLRRVAQIVERRTGAAPRLQIEQLLALLGYADQPPERADRLRLERSSRRRTDGPAVRAPDADADAAPTAVAELLSALAGEAPLVVIVDDLHDASPQTVDALGATLNRLVGPVLVVLLGRPEMVRTAGALTRLAGAEVHPLPPLRGADTARLLSAYLGGGRLPAADTDRLLATAQGNPFYLAELVTLLLERGALTRDGQHLAAGPAVAVRPAAQPRPRRGPRRPHRRAAGRVAGRAARRGRGRRHRTGGRAGRGPARQSTSDARPGAVAALDLERALDELLHRRMLLRTRGGYVFATPLMREAAYAGVGKADLADSHARLARWAAALAGPETGTITAAGLGWTPSVLDAFIADQAERATTLADAVSLRPDAPARSVAPLGVAALGRLAITAIRAGEPGQAAQLGERAARARPAGELPAADRLVRVSALLQLGRASEALAETQAVAAAPDVASREPGPGAAAAGPGPPDARRHRAGRPGLAGGRSPSPPTPTCRPSGPRCCGASAWRTTAGAGCGRRRPAFREALAIAEAAGDRRGEAWALQNLAWVTTTLGDFAGAEATLGQAARLFAELGDASGRAWLRGTTAFTRLLAGRLHEARRLANAFLPFGERVGERWAVGTLRAVEAFAVGRAGRPHRGRPRGPAGLPRVRRDRRRLGPRAVAGRPGGGGPRAGRARARDRPAHRRRRATARRPGTRCCSASPGPSAASPCWTWATRARPSPTRTPCWPWSSRTTSSTRPGSGRGCCSAAPGWRWATSTPR